MVENGKFLKRLRNGHLKKSAVTVLFHPSRSPKTAKTPRKVHLRLRFQNLGKPRTAGLCGWAAGACDCGPLSCTKIEQPSPLEKPSCKVRLFVQNRSRKYRQKVTATMLIQTTSHPVFQLLAHSGSHAESRVFQMGVVSLPSDRSARFGNPAWPGGRAANFAVFGSWPGALPKNAESLRNSDALIRVAVPRRRGPAGLRDPVVRLLMLRFSVSVRKVSAQSPVNATRSFSHLNPSTTQPSSKNRTQRLTRRNVCALAVAILEVSCYTDGHRKPLKKFLNFYENCVRNGTARASI